MTYIRFYDDDGKYALDAYFDKLTMKYDAGKGKIIVPADGIKINETNDDYYDDGDDDDEVSCSSTSSFSGAKVLYMTFTKRASKNLHYSL